MVSSTDGATTTALVSCDTGYTISGDNVMSCRTDGTWNISTPSCGMLFQDTQSILTAKKLSALILS